MGKGSVDDQEASRCGAAGDMDVRLSGCHETRMMRSLHAARSPMSRRSHCRHDHHWLVRVQTQPWWVSRARAPIASSGLRACRPPAACRGPAGGARGNLTLRGLSGDGGGPQV